MTKYNHLARSALFYFSVTEWNKFKSIANLNKFHVQQSQAQIEIHLTFT